MEQDDPKVHAVVDKLLDVLNTPSEAVQRAVSACLSPLMQSKQVCKNILTLDAFTSDLHGRSATLSALNKNWTKNNPCLHIYSCPSFVD